MRAVLTLNQPKLAKQSHLYLGYFVYVVHGHVYMYHRYYNKRVRRCVCILFPFLLI